MAISFLSSLLVSTAKPCPYREAALKLLPPIEATTIYEPKPGETKVSYFDTVQEINKKVATFSYPLSPENRQFAIEHRLIAVLTEDEKAKDRLTKVNQQMGKVVPIKKNKGAEAATELNRI